MGAEDVFWSEFISSLDDPDTAAELSDKAISEVIARFRAHSATITDPTKQAEFNRVGSKIIARLDSELLALQISLDEIQSERKLLKTQIDDLQIDSTEKENPAP